MTIEFHAFGCVKLFARLHTQQHIVGLGVVGLDIVQVVGRDHGDVQVFMHLKEHQIQLALW